MTTTTTPTTTLITATEAAAAGAVAIDDNGLLPDGPCGCSRHWEATMPDGRVVEVCVDRERAETDGRAI